tara:strand:- start:1655 stop:3454 length:1800 start_codon:yes stop_codon:yes gene_type:complete
MAKGKNIPIKYTNREFDSIKDDLIKYAKRYYPNNYNDFTQASFGSMMFDMVAYVGDMMSYYVDYQANESFLDTSVEFSNLRKHARALGYSYSGVPVSYGIASFFILVPANVDGTAPDSSYIPVLKKGASMSSANGASFLLLEDVDFANPSNDVIEARYDETNGGVTYYAIRGHGQVSSGTLRSVEADLTDSKYIKFRKVKVGDSTISEIVKVTDSEGNEYYEVDYLSQETVLLETTNPTAREDGVRSIMKPFVTARRFVVEQDNTGTYLQFGFGSDDDDDSGLADPSKVAINLHARDHLTNRSIDPSSLLGTDKLGISPTNTRLDIVYRMNDSTNTNVAANGLVGITNATLKYLNESSLDSAVLSVINSSLEVNNENPIAAQSIDISTDEIRVRAKNYYATQNRAVSKQDYEALVYNMPPKFGGVKRVNAISDPMATNRKLALYIVSESGDGILELSNMRIKNNIKTWLSQYKGINDQLEIFDPYIINFGIDFEVSADNRFSKEEVLSNCFENIKSKYNEKFYIGEPIYITEIQNILSKTRGVVDVKTVTINNLYGGDYSSTPFDFDKVISKDGSYYKIPKNVILELRFPDKDLKGKIK